MRYSNVNPGGWNPLLGIEWRVCDDDGNNKMNNYTRIWMKADGQEVVVRVWIYDAVDRIRIRPDRRPCDFTLTDIVLLVPDLPTGPKVGDGVADIEAGGAPGGDRRRRTGPRSPSR